MRLRYWRLHQNFPSRSNIQILNGFSASVAAGAAAAVSHLVHDAPEAYSTYV